MHRLFTALLLVQSQAFTSADAEATGRPVDVDELPDLVDVWVAEQVAALEELNVLPPLKDVELFCVWRLGITLAGVTLTGP